eukprot:CAMPEP_0182451454 /NCGR_PEP_ID=MMETSP1172-20130603/43728_1 /TAXON_ID=708627 /ORGANISM="Timspurckia oligopyrenoides, Strain CCMP3278" /LENGTH=530 /DNA_ID=CAMNT_0024649229 /DNA_START=310 /DNA_END=1899 /DNA_ORIENTATION=+
MSSHGVLFVFHPCVIGIRQKVGIQSALVGRGLHSKACNSIQTQSTLVHRHRIASQSLIFMKSSSSTSTPPSNKQSELQVASRADDYSQWYLDVISSSELADSSPVKGCMVIRPNGYAVWEMIRDALDSRLKSKGVTNAYFPLFIPQSFLSKEAQHVDGFAKECADGFAKECALVTHHRLRAVPGGKPGELEPDPDAKLEEPLVVRPTSETIIWHMFGKWIQSYRDLPLVINQWANVVRWEMRTRPFLRTAEFLWQEGHTAHATAEEALEYSRQMIDVYADLCENVLAIPVIRGVKSPSERFAGAEETFCIEALMQNGWALQAGTSHFLGQNFARAFDVCFQKTDGERELVWATSWGVSTRLMGALIMTHSDDTGLVLPPTVATIQVVIIPIWNNDSQKAEVLPTLDAVVERLKKAGIRLKVDDRDSMRPGAKYFDWERKGVPFRVEMGPRDVKKGAVFCAKRTGGPKFSISIDDDLESNVEQALEEIQDELLENARKRLVEKTFQVNTYDEMKELIAQGGESAGLYVAPW